jgi:glycosyltransferase involved in cell wall biosynthesis
MTVEGTRDAMAKALLHMLAGNREQLGSRGRDYVTMHLAWPAIVRRLDALYQDCITASRNCKR